MAQSIKKTISPCTAKGKYGGKRGGANRAYKQGGVSSGCECNRPWVLFGARIGEPKSCQFSLNLENQFLIKGSVKAGKTLIPVVPCNETFLLPTSTGTRKYKAATKAKFRGCYPLEEKLLEKNEVRHDPFDDLASDMNKYSRGVVSEHLIAEKGHETKSTGWTSEETQKRREQYERLLTFRQREAIRLIYLENEKGLSDEKVAKKLKISLESLKDRLESALGRIKKINPSFKWPERRRSSERAKYWEPPDSELDGFYRKSNSGPYPVRILDPTFLQVMEEVAPENFAKFGFGEKKKDPKANERAIKKWALEMTPPIRLN